MNLLGFNILKKNKADIKVQVKEKDANEEMLVAATMGISGQAGSISSRVNRHLYEGDTLDVEELTKDLEGLSKYYHILKDLVKGRDLETNSTTIENNLDKNPILDKDLENAELPDVLKCLFNENCAYKMREYLEDNGWKLSDRCLSPDSYTHVEYMRDNKNKRSVDYINVVYGSCDESYSEFRQQVYKLSCIEEVTMEEMCQRILRYIKGTSFR